MKESGRKLERDVSVLDSEFKITDNLVSVLKESLKFCEEEVFLFLFFFILNLYIICNIYTYIYITQLKMEKKITKLHLHVKKSLLVSKKIS